LLAETSEAYEEISCTKWLPSFLADRTNGRAIATLLRLSSVVVCRL